MQFDYEKSIWGAGEAGLKWSSPASFRLRGALESLKNIPAGGKILEIGCGAGQFIRGIKKCKPDLECYGCDISSAAIGFAKTNPGVVYALSGIRSLPYGDNFFDAVLIFDVLEHAEDAGSLLSETGRVLKKDGVFYCFVPCEKDYLSVWNFLDKLGLKKDLTRKYAGHINFFSRASLKVFFEAHNFKIIRQRYSEHLLGQMVGVAAFMMMDKEAKRKGVSQINNEQYFSGLNGKGMGVLKKIINTLIYLESVIFSRIPSPNVHAVMRNKKL